MIRLAFLFALGLVAATADAAEDFARSDWPELLVAHRGHALVVPFWGLDCAPCLRELPTWGRFVADHAGLAVVFIETTAAPADTVANALQAAHLNAAVQLQLVTPFDEELWFAVDRNWQGELPLTMLFDADGQARALNGEVDFAALSKWSERGHSR